MQIVDNMAIPVMEFQVQGIKDQLDLDLRMNVLKILIIEKYQDSTSALADCESAASVIHWDKLGNNKIENEFWLT